MNRPRNRSPPGRSLLRIFIIDPVLNIRLTLPVREACVGVEVAVLEFLSPLADAEAGQVSQLVAGVRSDH